LWFFHFDGIACPKEWNIGIVPACRQGRDC
jgi:hypothetical protein